MIPGTAALTLATFAPTVTATANVTVTPGPLSLVLTGYAPYAGPVILDASPSGVAVVMINRPAKKNAFDAATISALRETFETLHSADHVRVVFLRGAGGAFCAGADLGWMADAAGWSEQENVDDARQLGR